MIQKLVLYTLFFVVVFEVAPDNMLVSFTQQNSRSSISSGVCVCVCVCVFAVA